MPKFKVQGANKDTGEETTLYIYAATPEAVENEVRGAGVLASSVMEEKVDYGAAIAHLRRDGTPSHEYSTPPIKYLALAIFGTAATVTGVLCAVAGVALLFKASSSEDLNMALIGLSGIALGSLIAGAGECMRIARKFAIARSL